ncbi:MAG: efflux RND transporter periplasmic adaptor subunit, partial [Gammaproteobacteria bacterium]|nr:efflux RND transporter periplasmic adaptor subunit [Gammaproteobacteria bacterium]
KPDQHFDKPGKSPFMDMDLVPRYAEDAPAPPAPDEPRRVLYWYDPMKPDQHFDKPGRSPFMDMDLVPRYAEEASAPSARQDAPGAALQPLAVQTVKAARATLETSVLALGELAYNQRDIAIVQARADAFVARGFGLAPGDVVARGAPLVELEVPAWIAAQREYLGVLALDDAALAAAARARLELLGMPGEVLAALDAQHAPIARVTLRSPIAGVVTTLDARVGMRVAAGATLVALNGIDPLWLEVAVPEREAARLASGTPLRAEIAGHTGETFTGIVEQVLPAADSETRNVRLRARVANPDGRLRAGLSARVRLADAPRKEALLLPSAAVIRGGRRDLVMRRAVDGRFLPVEVSLGAEAAGQVEVLAGLSAGDEVAASAQFLLDAEANLQGLAPAPATSREAPR